MKMVKFNKLITWQLCAVLVSLVFIIVTAVFPYTHDGFLKWRILVYLSLAGEMNIAVWWSGALLLLSGLISHQIASWDADSRDAWMAIAFLFFFLSLDELGSIHERVGNLSVGLAAYIIIAMIAGSALLCSVWALWRKKNDKKGLILLLAGIALLVSAAPNEYLEHHFEWPGYLLGPRVAFEEGLELLGAFVCLAGIVRYQSADGLLSFSTASGDKTKTAKLLFAGFGLHLGAAWISDYNIEIGYRGNPAVWFFMAVFVLLALYSLLKAVRASGSSFVLYLFNFCYFTVCAISSLFFILPNPSSNLNNLGWVANSNVILASQLLVVLILYFILTRRLSGIDVKLLAATASTLGLGWYIGSQFATYSAAGVFALGVATLFLSHEKAFT